MTTTDRAVADLTALRDVDADLDSLFSALADPDRRFILACLDDYSHTLTLRDLAARLAAWKEDVSVADPPAEGFEDTYLLLYHRHVPQLAEANVVEYDPDRGLVRLRENGDEPRLSVELAKLDGRMDTSQAVEG